MRSDRLACYTHKVCLQSAGRLVPNGRPAGGGPCVLHPLGPPAHGRQGHERLRLSAPYKATRVLHRVRDRRKRGDWAMLLWPSCAAAAASPGPGLGLRHQCLRLLHLLPQLLHLRHRLPTTTGLLVCRPLGLVLGSTSTTRPDVTAWHYQAGWPHSGSSSPCSRGSGPKVCKPACLLLSRLPMADRTHPLRSQRPHPGLHAAHGSLYHLLVPAAPAIQHRINRRGVSDHSACHGMCHVWA